MNVLIILVDSANHRRHSKIAIFFISISLWAPCCELLFCSRGRVKQSLFKWVGESRCLTRPMLKNAIGPNHFLKILSKFFQDQMACKLESNPRSVECCRRKGGPALELPSVSGVSVSLALCRARIAAAYSITPGSQCATLIKFMRCQTTRQKLIK